MSLTHSCTQKWWKECMKYCMNFIVLSVLYSGSSHTLQQRLRSPRRIRYTWFILGALNQSTAIPPLPNYWTACHKLQFCPRTEETCMLRATMTQQFTKGYSNF